MLCAKCKEDFPTEILSQIIENDEFIMPVCGICALEIINAIHGINLDRFRGEMAEKNRQAACSIKNSRMSLRQARRTERV